MNLMAAECPWCGHGEHSVLELIEDDDGFTVGVLAHCLGCERTWRTDTMAEV